MKNKVGLVLEGGGMRGAYTAGVLCWLMENDFKFDYVVGISSGALYGGMFVMEKAQSLKAAAIEVAADKNNVGWLPIKNERQFVGYDWLYDTVTKKLDYPLEDVDKIEEKFEVGVYDVDAEKTVWIQKDRLAKDPLFIKAACTLPIVGRYVIIGGRRYMDGGITTMIPVQRSIDAGCSRHVVVTTKSEDYVRKEQNFFQKHLLRVVYRKSPQLVKDFEARKTVYYEERKLIKTLVDEKKAAYLYPTEEVGVGRFKGSSEQFEDLFEMAYSDCDKRRSEIESMFKD